MYAFMSNLLADKKDGYIFTIFDLWHMGYMAFFVAMAAFVCWYLRNKSREKRIRVIEIFSMITFGLYMADVFLMPFAYGEIHIEKLPFHVCTAMCVMCFLSRRVEWLKKFKIPIATMGFISNLSFLVVPAGVMWNEVHPLCYRAMQTLCFHGFMAVYGFLVLLYEREDFSWKKYYRDIMVMVGMTVWALMGNTLYNHDSAFYNWFFVVRDPFFLIPEQIAPYVMPFVDIAFFVLTTLLVHFVFQKVSKFVPNGAQREEIR